MKKQYKSFRQVINESGLLKAINYKILELRDKSPKANKALSWLIIPSVSSTHYNESYISQWDENGLLKKFNSNYQEDFYKKLA